MGCTLTARIVFVDNTGSFAIDDIAHSVEGSWRNTVSRFDGKNDIGFVDFPAENQQLLEEMLESDDNVISYRIDEVVTQFEINEVRNADLSSFDEEIIEKLRPKLEVVISTKNWATKVSTILTIDEKGRVIESIGEMFQGAHMSEADRESARRVVEQHVKLL